MDYSLWQNSQPSLARDRIQNSVTDSFWFPGEGTRAGFQTPGRLRGAEGSHLSPLSAGPRLPWRGEQVRASLLPLPAASRASQHLPHPSFPPIWFYNKSLLESALIVLYPLLCGRRWYLSWPPEGQLHRFPHAAGGGSLQEVPVTPQPHCLRLLLLRRRLPLATFSRREGLQFGAGRPLRGRARALPRCPGWGRHCPAGSSAPLRAPSPPSRRAAARRRGPPKAGELGGKRWEPARRESSETRWGTRGIRTGSSKDLTAACLRFSNLLNCINTSFPLSWSHPNFFFFFFWYTF